MKHECLKVWHMTACVCTEHVKAGRAAGATCGVREVDEGDEQNLGGETY